MAFSRQRLNSLSMSARFPSDHATVVSLWNTRNTSAASREQLRFLGAPTLSRC
jgi:hypothetical protein